MKIFLKIALFAVFFSGLPLHSTAQLHAGFTMTNNSGCGPLLTHFTNTSTGGAVSCHWIFDITHPYDTSNLTNPLWIYSTPGYYDVRLVVTNSIGQKDSVTFTHAVFVSPQPIVRFTTPDTILACPPLTVNFTNQSDTGGCTPYYTWFIDSAHIHTTNATYTFTTPGYYNISLRETDSCGCVGSLTKTSYIKIDSLPITCFTTPDTTPCTSPATVCFNNCTSGGFSYLWNFGDGFSDTARAPCHLYATTGNYSDTLTALSAAGCRSTLVKPNYIRVGYVSFGFYTVPSTICAGSTFTCFDTSFSGASHLWRFNTDSSGISTAASPSFSYTLPGTYVILDSIWDASGCHSIVYDTVTVLPSPDPSFTASSVYRCNPSDTVVFTPASMSGVVSYQWSFGDAISGLRDTSTLAIPTHIYDSMGSYSVSLFLIDTAGCTSYNYTSSFINIAIPWDTLALDSFTVIGCIPLTITYSTAISPWVPYITDSVVFGDGTYDTTHSGTHTYTTDGFFRPRHYFHLPEGCIDSSYRSYNRVYAGHHPTSMSTSVSTDTTCPSIPVTFVGHCTGCTYSAWLTFPGYPPTEYHGIFSSYDSLVFDLRYPGWCKGLFLIENYGCKDTLYDSVFVREPGALFLPEQLDCNDHFTIHFRTNFHPSSYKWYFGDGDSSTLASPTHTYGADGVYTVELYDTLTSTGCYSMSRKTVKIIANPTSLVANDTVVCPGQFVAFDDYPDFKTHISFGDGEADSLSPYYRYYYHQYWTPGVYTVQMRLENKFHCKDTVTQTSFITVERPGGGLWATPVLGCAPLTVSFHDTDLVHLGIPMATRQWIWSAADTAITGYAADTTHTYPEGTFLTYLIDLDSNGCNSIDSILITAVKPHAWFTASYIEGCPHLNIPFFDTNSFATYLWDFGDGSSLATGVSPTHAYTANGLYSPTVMITTIAGGAYPAGCTDTVTRANYIAISDTSTHVGFVLSDSFASCPPFIVLASNTTTSTAGNHYRWKYGFDSTTINSVLTNATAVYTYPGNYTITLIDSNNLGCIDSVKRSIHVGGPSGTFTFTPDSICAPGSTHLHLTATSISALDSYYVWFVPPYGAFVTDTPGFTAHYTYPGTYNPYVIIDSNGCQVAIHSTDSIHVLPAAHITVNHPGVVCGVSALLTASGAVYYTWSPAISLSCTTCYNPTASPTAATNYTVIGTNIYGCKDTATTFVVIDTPNSITITGKAHICIGECDSLYGYGGSVYAWFGTALSCNICQDVIVCPTATYVYTLVATDSLGCNDTAKFKVHVEPLPVLYFLPTPVVVCNGDSTLVTAFGTNTYNWRPNLDITCDTCTTTRLYPISSLVYTVTGTSIYGCKSTVDVPVTVIDSTGYAISADTTICVGASAHLYAHGGIKYLWTNPYMLSDANSATPFANPDTTIIYTLVITENVCFTDTAHVKVTVAPIPIISLHQTFTIIAGTEIQLNGHVANNVPVKYTWTPADYLTCSECPNPIATPTANTTYTVKVISTDGCVADTTLTINMYCDNSQVFIPNTFTPNGDGVNDQFYISGKGLSTIKQMRIYDRWGEVVFDRSNIQPNEPSMGWDGTFGSRELTADVFIYVVEAVCELGEVFQYKGSITLVR